MDDQAGAAAQSLILVFGGAFGGALFTWMFGALARRSDRRHERETRWDPARRDLFVEVAEVLDEGDEAMHRLRLLCLSAPDDAEAIQRQVAQLIAVRLRLKALKPRLRLEITAVFIEVDHCRRLLEVAIVESSGEHASEFSTHRREAERAMRAQLHLPDVKPARPWDGAVLWFRRVVLRKKPRIVVIDM